MPSPCPSRSAVVIALSLAAAAAAQTPILLPAMAATADGADANFSVLSAGSSGRAHIQALYATSDLGVANGAVHSLRFRSVPISGLPVMSAYLRVEMSVSPLAFGAATTTFAANHGADRAVVFDANANFAAIPGNQSFPPASLSPLLFPTPFAYDASRGASLVVDISNFGNSLGYSAPVGGITMGGGQAASVYVDGRCLHSQGSPSGAYGYQQYQPYPGGSFSLSFLGYPARRASLVNSVMLLGASGPGSNLGGIVLPALLTDFGLPAAPFCKLAVSPDVALPMTYIQGTSGSTGVIAFGPMPIPNDANLTGSQFFTQALSVDFDNSMPQAQIFPSLALRWTVGTGNRPNCTTLARHNDTNPPAATGSLAFSQAPVVTLELR